MNRRSLTVQSLYHAWMGIPLSYVPCSFSEAVRTKLRSVNVQPKDDLPHDSDIIALIEGRTHFIQFIFFLSSYNHRKLHRDAS
jgi:hypothetical protein